MQNLVLIDLAPFTPQETDHALNYLYFTKAINHDGDGIWDVHPSPFVRRLVELFTQRGLWRLEQFRKELTAWMEGHRHVASDAPPRPQGSMERWTSAELALAKIYLQTLPPESFTLDDYMMLVDWLVQRYLPTDEVRSESEWLAVRSTLMGRVQANMHDLTAEQADQIISRLPLTIGEAAQLFSFTPMQRAIIDFARVQAGDHIVRVATDVRQKMRSTIAQHVAERQFGAPPSLPTTGSLQTQLFDQFAGFNRDWRRVAVTEATECAGQGYIASLASGSHVKRVEQYRGACAFCRDLDGQVFNVVAAADAAKADPWKAIWPGKTNVGRSASPRKRVGSGLIERDPHEMWWPATGAQHPHCRGRWVPTLTRQAGDESEFGNWLRATLGAKQ